MNNFVKAASETEERMLKDNLIAITKIFSWEKRQRERSNF